jgi:hypothetical protein
VPRPRANRSSDELRPKLQERRSQAIHGRPGPDAEPHVFLQPGFAWGVDADSPLREPINEVLARDNRDPAGDERPPRSGCRNDNRRKNRYSRDRSSRTSFSVAATEGRFSNVAIAPAIASGCTPVIARSSPSANPGGATAQAQEISGRPAHGAKDRITMTLSSSRASGRRENSEYSANRSSMTTYVHARDNRTVSAGETIDPSGFDGESMMARPFAGISAAISGPTTASPQAPRTIDMMSDLRQFSVTRFRGAAGGNAMIGPRWRPARTPIAESTHPKRCIDPTGTR